MQLHNYLEILGMFALISIGRASTQTPLLQTLVKSHREFEQFLSPNPNPSPTGALSRKEQGVMSGAGV